MSNVLQYETILDRDKSTWENWKNHESKERGKREGIKTRQVLKKSKLTE